MAGYAKMTISVPSDLKARMDEVDGVNWSAAACAAFGRKLAEVSYMGEQSDVLDIAAGRYLAHEAEYRAECEDEGRKAGREWALNAEPRALNRLFKAKGDPAYPKLFDDEGDSLSVVLDLEADLAYEIWAGEATLDQQEYATERAFLVGFVEGALATREEIVKRAKERKGK